MSDLIDRDLLKRRMYEEAFEKDSSMQRWDSGCWIRYKLFENILNEMPSAEPERLTDDDFETIRIHLNACKEKLCNQRRWKEADEYQRIIDRFMAFASAQPVAKDINVPTNDYISRQAAIDAVNKLTYPSDLMDVKRSLVNIPPAEPERMKGRWIRKDDGHFLQCEFCNRVIREPFGYRFKFCPNCGADMR